MKALCPVCEKENEIQLINKKEKIKVRQEEITVDVEFFKCGECEEEFENTRGADYLAEAYKEYRHHHNMLQPEEIKNWRKSYGLTQKELSSLLGWGEITLSRYENGALQDAAHETTLQLAREPHNLLKLIQDTPEAINPEKRERLIAELSAAEAESCSFERVYEERLARYSPDVFSGYKKLDLTKFSNAVLFLCKGGQLKTKLNKLLFYADFKHFKENAVSITGARYAHLPHGPVPDNYEFFFASLTHSRQIEVDEVQVYQYYGENFVSTIEPDLSIYDTSELKVLAEIKELFKDYSATQIRDFSHEERGYQETLNHGLISYSFAENLQI